MRTHLATSAPPANAQEPIAQPDKDILQGSGHDSLLTRIRSHFQKASATSALSSDTEDTQDFEASDLQSGSSSSSRCSSPSSHDVGWMGPSNTSLPDHPRSLSVGSNTVSLQVCTAFYRHWRRLIKMALTASVLLAHLVTQSWILYTVVDRQEVYFRSSVEFGCAAILSTNLPLVCWLIFEWMRTESSFAAWQASWLFLLCWIHETLTTISKVADSEAWLWTVLGLTEQGKYSLTVLAVWWRVKMAEDAFLAGDRKHRQGCARCIVTVLVATLPVPLIRVYDWACCKSQSSLSSFGPALAVVDMSCKMAAFLVMGLLAWHSFTLILLPLHSCPEELRRKRYLWSEVVWAKHVVRRIRLAVVLLCLGGVIQHGFWLSFAVYNLLSRSSQVDGLARTWITFFDVPANIYIIFDFVTLQAIVGCFRSQSSCGDAGSASSDQESASRETSGRVQSVEWQKKVDSLASRYITAEELLLFYAALGSAEAMPHYDPDGHTMNDIVRAAIIPGSITTDERGLSYAEVLERQRRRLDSQQPRSSLGLALGTPGGPPVDHGEEGRLYAQRMVTHDWSSLFVHTVAAVLADALNQAEFGPIAYVIQTELGVDKMLRRLRRRQAQDTRYWICAFCVNQHLTICSGFPPEPPLESPEYKRFQAHACDSVTLRRHPCCTCLEPKCWDGDYSETNKFDDIMKLLSQRVPELRQVVAIDRNFNLFSRVWCVAELVQAHQSDIDQNVCLPWKRSLDANTGDVGTYLKLATLSVNDCSAARSEDKDRILHKIRSTSGIPEFDARLQATIFGDNGLLGKDLVGFDVIYAAARAAMRVKVAAEHLEQAQAGNV